MNICIGMAHSSPAEKTTTSNGRGAGGGGGGVGGGATPAVAAVTTVRKQSLVSRFRKKFHLYSHKKSTAAAVGGGGGAQAPAPETTANPAATTTPATTTPLRSGRRIIVPGLPRQATLQRVQSEKRERLKPNLTPQHERRRSLDPASPTGRTSARSLPPITASPIQPADAFGDGNTRPSMLDVGERRTGEEAEKVGEEREEEHEVEIEKKVEREEKEEEKEDHPDEEDHEEEEERGRRGSALARIQRGPRESEPQIISASEEGLSDSDSDSWTPKEDREPPLVSKEIEEEMEWRWILNLSMHFRDESNREKFFVTYAQERNLRRRLTISCDYRNAQEGTLEMELFRLRLQRDKSAKIYEAIRDSLRQIHFHDTITNLKLETTDGRLHVHVTEDVNEIIHYPPVNAIAHLRCPKYRECDLEFDSHLSGFVYKVGVRGEIMIKKEIPGPDTVDEFLYEINALYALADSDNVIQFGGCVVDDQRQKVKGLLISYASRGALIDILFNQRGRLPWSRREKWAKQIVAGLSEIHEAGYVQGDFTLSNIVIDQHDNAKIIDINRRGCPVGWEPPEITAMIEGLQRIGMYIGVKSDVFQLGMVLWGMAHEMDEPEAMQRPLTMDHAPENVPAYFRELVEACLCDKPQGRPSAKELLAMFPERIDDAPEIVETKQGNGRPLPGSWANANGYFSGTNNTTPVPTAPTHLPLSDENLESLQSTHSAAPSSLPPLTRQDVRRDDDNDEPPFSPTTQVIMAAPSSISRQGSLASLQGGVVLDEVSPRHSGVAIPEYLQMMMLQLPTTEDGVATPRPVTARTTATVRGGGGGGGGGWDTPTTEALSFEDAKESFGTPSESGAEEEEDAGVRVS